MTRRAVVLHVTESYGAGTATAIHRFVRSVPEAEHHLLRRVRADSSITDGEEAFASITDLPAPGLGALRTVRRTVAALGPGTVHLHSSIGGALGRAAVGASRRRRLVYSPHCYAFERQDLRPAARAVIRAAEAVLSLNTSVTAACSPREAELARRLRPGARALFVPNVASAPRLRFEEGSSESVVYTIGRAGAQKDPAFFAAVALAVRSTAPSTRFVWVGGGDPMDEQRLRDAGVEVTGWLSSSDAWPSLPANAVYLHTAAWEGYPLAVLEAQRAGSPIAARRIPALAHVAAELVADEPTALGRLVLRLLGDEGARAANRASWASEAERNTEARQRDALLRCYELTARTS